MDFDREHHHSTLTQALRSLPSYEPPARVWDSLEQQLTGQQHLQDQLCQLPTYQPPTRVWDAIENELQQSAKPQQVIGRRRRFWPAAALLAGLCLGLWWLSQPSTTHTRIEYSTAWQTVALPATDTGDTDATFTSLLAAAERSPVSDRAAVQQLRQEYEEITAARREVQTILQRYGTAEDLLKTLARLERERAQIIKKLARWTYS